MSKDVEKWPSVLIDRPTQERLVKQILKGYINRAEFPELWPDIELIKVIWPEGD